MKRVMKRAWEIARNAAEKFGRRAIEYIALALRDAWEEIKKMGRDITERIEELEAKGFKRWQKNGMDRMYINASTLGLECSYYKTGNISSAWFNGEHISNSMGYRMKNAKTYIDLVKKVLVSDSCTLASAAAALIGIDSYGKCIVEL